MARRKLKLTASEQKTKDRILARATAKIRNGEQIGPADLDLDPINPQHYKDHPSGIECITITRHMNFNLGNVVKYIWRHQTKPVPIEELRKAAWYLNNEIDRVEKYGT